MKRSWMICGIAGLAWMGMAAVARAEESPSSHQVGLGAHYWTALKSIDVDQVDKNGFSYLACYRYRYQWIGVEADLEWFEKGFGGAQETVYQPQAYLVVGKVIYAAAGIGGYYADGKFADNPFYALRAGLDIPILPILHLDINANYRFENWNDLSAEGKEIGTDTVTLGAAARLAF